MPGLLKVWAVCIYLDIWNLIVDGGLESWLKNFLTLDASRFTILSQKTLDTTNCVQDGTTNTHLQHKAQIIFNKQVFLNDCHPFKNKTTINVVETLNFTSIESSRNLRTLVGKWWQTLLVDFIKRWTTNKRSGKLFSGVIFYQNNGQPHRAAETLQKSFEHPLYSFNLVPTKYFLLFRFETEK